MDFGLASIEKESNHLSKNVLEEFVQKGDSLQNEIDNFSEIEYKSKESRTEDQAINFQTQLNKQQMQIPSELKNENESASNNLKKDKFETNFEKLVFNKPAQSQENSKSDSSIDQSINGCYPDTHGSNLNIEFSDFEKS